MLRSDYLAWDSSGNHHDRLFPAYQAARDNIRPHHMVRNDCSAPVETKHRIGTGIHEWDDVRAEVIFDDPSLFEIISDFPSEEIPIWRCSWLEPESIADYPIKYHAYTSDGTTMGTYHHYPQRFLP